MAEVNGAPLDLCAMENVAREAARVAPGPWERDSVDSEGGHGKFAASAVYATGVYLSGQNPAIVDTHNSEIACIYTEADEDGATSWDEPGRLVCEHIATFDPPTALRLIEEQRELVEAAKSLQALRAFHAMNPTRDTAYAVSRASAFLDAAISKVGASS